MRKIGIICAVLGAVLAGALAGLTQTAWFAAEHAKAMSELEEWVIGGLWAGAVLCLLGLLLLLRSAHARDEDATFKDYLPEDATAGTRICAGCGTPLASDVFTCPACGMPVGERTRDGSWQCPGCGHVWDDNASVCLNCGYHRFGE